MRMGYLVIQYVFILPLEDDRLNFLRAQMDMLDFMDIDLDTWNTVSVGVVDGFPGDGGSVFF